MYKMKVCTNIIHSKIYVYQSNEVAIGLAQLLNAFRFVKNISVFYNNRFLYRSFHSVSLRYNFSRVTRK